MNFCYLFDSEIVGRKPAFRLNVRRSIGEN
jgi:hypothetical protein